MTQCYECDNEIKERGSYYNISTWAVWSGCMEKSKKIFEEKVEEFLPSTNKINPALMNKASKKNN